MLSTIQLVIVHAIISIRRYIINYLKISLIELLSASDELMIFLNNLILTLLCKQHFSLVYVYKQISEM